MKVLLYVAIGAAGLLVGYLLGSAADFFYEGARWFARH
jgi:hypothetical protein